MFSYLGDVGKFNDSNRGRAGGKILQQIIRYKVKLVYSHLSVSVYTKKANNSTKEKKI